MGFFLAGVVFVVSCPVSSPAMLFEKFGTAFFYSMLFAVLVAQFVVLNRCELYTVFLVTRYSGELSSDVLCPCFVRILWSQALSGKVGKVRSHPQHSVRKFELQQVQNF